MKQKTKSKKKHTEPTKPDSTEVAMKLLQDPDFFGKLLGFLTSLGLVAEERNAIVLWICGISALLSKPLNIIVKGQSSTGKNYLVKNVLRLFPEGAIRELTSSSKLSWNYAGSDFKHKVLYLQERNEASGAVHPARLLISEGKLVRIVSVKEDGVWTTKRFVAEGPIASISTTTQEQLEIDDETRNVSIYTDSSREQTKRIVIASASREDR